MTVVTSSWTVKSCKFTWTLWVVIGVSDMIRLAFLLSVGTLFPPTVPTETDTFAYSSSVIGRPELSKNR